jgi:hypothetical protein
MGTEGLWRETERLWMGTEPLWRGALNFRFKVSGGCGGDWRGLKAVGG